MRKVYPQATYIRSIVAKKGVISHTNDKANSNTLLSYESTPSSSSSSSTNSFSVSSYFYSIFPFFELKSNRNLKDGNTANNNTMNTITNTNTKVIRISEFWMVIMKIPLI